MLYAVIRHLKTLTTQNHGQLRNLKRRDSLILLTVLLGTVSEMLMFLFDYSYHQHYLIGSLRTFFILMISYYSIIIIKSVRLYIFMLLLVLSMSIDILCFSSVDFYRTFKSYIYGEGLSFANIYRVFEICCILFTIARIFNVRYINNFIWSIVVILVSLDKKLQNNKGRFN